MGDLFMEKQCLGTGSYAYHDTTSSMTRIKDQKMPKREACPHNITLGKYLKIFFPHGVVAVDEPLFLCRLKCGFIQYMPEKVFQI